MSLYFTSLNSGSNGNCYYIGNEQEAVLVDAGISCRETEKRMQRLGLSMQKVKAIFVSHEHSDHIQGIPVLAKKYGLPVFLSRGTWQGCRFGSSVQNVQYFTAHNPVYIGDLVITAFPKLHDAAEPYSFVITCKGIKVGVFTDIGAPCDQLTHYFKQCHAAFLEANYDEAMLENGSYPYHLKNRIRGGRGHLSNRQAFQFFNSHRSPALSHLILAHLSKENNCPNLVQRLFASQAGKTHIIVASRFGETPVFTIEIACDDSINRGKMPLSQLPVQASLF